MSSADALNHLLAARTHLADALTRLTGPDLKDAKAVQAGLDKLIAKLR